MHVHFEKALLPDGWTQRVRLSIEAGRIIKVEPGVEPRADDERHAVAIPGMPNLHSHAFQRAMAGLTEMRGRWQDNFWSWREQMYRFALALSPDQVEAIASQLYAEMLEAGFTRVGEFHYLHHDIDGRPYDSIAEMAERIATAATRTGIGLTLLPVLYAHSNFGGSPPTEAQRRFVNDVDRFAALFEQTKQVVAQVPDAVLGIAPHSLRAVTPSELDTLATLAGSSPIHIHIAEQVKEIDDCVRWCGSRPVTWLLDQVSVDHRWCLVHATHITQSEIKGVAQSGAVVGLCPITEANLGDGTFDAVSYRAANGRFGIGSDSNVEIGLAAELRQLEYSQRLARQNRNVIAADGLSTGRTLLDSASRGGTQALGLKSAGLNSGASADIVTLKNADTPYAHLKDDQLLDAWIFSAGNRMIDCVWVRGEKLVSGGRHRDREGIARGFTKAIQSLVSS